MDASCRTSYSQCMYPRIVIIPRWQATRYTTSDWSVTQDQYSYVFVSLLLFFKILTISLAAELLNIQSHTSHGKEILPKREDNISPWKQVLSKAATGNTSHFQH